MLQIDPELLSYRGAAEVHAMLLKALRPAPDLTVSEWADKNRKLSSRHAHEHGQWSTDRVPFMREPMDNMSARSPCRSSALIKGGQIGGPLSLDTKVPTEAGWTTMGEIRVGDVVFDEKGNRTRVDALSPIFEGRPCFEVEFSDGSTVVCDDGHLWTVWDEKDARRPKVRTLRMQEIASTFSRGMGNRYAVDVARPLDLPETPLPIPPYTLGAWLGDGNQSSNQITTHDDDVEEMAAAIRAEGITTLVRRLPGSKGKVMNILIGGVDGSICKRGHDMTLPDARSKHRVCRRCHVENVLFHRFGTPRSPTVRPLSLWSGLVALGLTERKHIPEVYLRSSPQQRLALLRGLMDTDGTITKKGWCSFVASNMDLARDVHELIASLGLKPTMSARLTERGFRGGPRQTDPAILFQVGFMAYSDSPVFGLARKRDRLVPVDRPGLRLTETRRRRIVDVRSVPSVPVRCISVDAPSRLFLVGETFIPTHNTEGANNVVGYNIASAPGPFLYVCPTLTVMKRTSARVQQMIDDDPKGLGKLVLPARKRDSKNSEREKHFPGGALYFATAQSAANLKSTMVRGMILDELEEYPADLEGQGDTVGVAKVRGTTAGDDFKMMLISTPGMKAVSQIEPAFLKRDQRRFFMPCPHCSTPITFEWENFVWTEGKPNTVRYLCQTCKEVPPNFGRIHEGRHKEAMLAKGVWVPKVLSDDTDFMQRLKDGDRSALDEFNKTAYHRSYYLPSFYATIGLTWAKIVEEWEQADGSQSAIKVIWNTMFARTYSPPGEAPSWERVRDRKIELRSREIPAWATFLSAGADIGQDHIEIDVWAYGRRRRRHLVEHLRIDGDPSDPDIQAQLLAVSKRLYLHPCGAVMNIRRLVIDRNHRPDLVDRMLMTMDRSKIIGVVGAKSFDAPIMVMAKRKERPEDASWGIDPTYTFVRAGVSSLKLELFGDLNLRQVDGHDVPPGWITINGDASDDWCKQLVSERLEYVGAKGRRPTPRFVGHGITRHEALDCSNYSRIGAELLGWSRWGPHDFDREEKAMQTLAEQIAVKIKEMELERQRNGDTRPVTVRDLYASLVLPGEEPVSPHRPPPVPGAAAPAAETTPVADPVDPAEVAAPEPVAEPAAAPRTFEELEAAREAELYAGVSNDTEGWGSGDGWGAADDLAPDRNSIVGCRPELSDLLSHSIRSAGDDDR
jgi:phage terminase large subunit GpA-like protein